jgi:tetratricopeptide (TPR) repeat protein
MEERKIEYYLNQLELCSEDANVANELVEHLLKTYSLDEIFSKSNPVIRKAILKKSMQLLQVEEYQLAKSLFERLIEASRFYISDEFKLYKQFQNVFEYYFYCFNNKLQVELVIPDEPILYYYLFYGFLLIEINEIDYALTIFEKVLDYNPYCADAYCEIADIYRKQGDFEKFLQTNQEIYRIAYTPRIVAKYFRNIGYYYIEKEEFDFATMAYFVSSHYADHPNVIHELTYISERSGREIVAPGLNEIEIAFDEKNMSPVANDQIVVYLMSLGELLDEAGEYLDAIYILSLLDDLINSKETKKRIEEIKIKTKLNA